MAECSDRPVMANIALCGAGAIVRAEAALVRRFAQDADAVETARRPFDEWRAQGGSIARHHGGGLFRSAWMEAEHGVGMDMLRKVKAALDPRNLFNPGKLGLPARADRRACGSVAIGDRCAAYRRDLGERRGAHPGAVGQSRQRYLVPQSVWLR